MILNEIIGRNSTEVYDVYRCDSVSTQHSRYQVPPYKCKGRLPLITSNLEKASFQQSFHSYIIVCSHSRAASATLCFLEIDALDASHAIAVATLSIH